MDGLGMRSVPGPFPTTTKMIDGVSGTLVGARSNPRNRFLIRVRSCSCRCVQPACRPLGRAGRATPPIAALSRLHAVRLVWLCRVREIRVPPFLAFPQGSSTNQSPATSSALDCYQLLIRSISPRTPSTGCRRRCVPLALHLPRPPPRGPRQITGGTSRRVPIPQP